MFIRPDVYIRVDGTTEIVDCSRIKDVSIYSSIDKTLPELTFKITDEQGDIINKLNIYVGCNIDVIIKDRVDYSNPNTKLTPVTLKLCTFSVSRIYDGFESNNGYGGYVQVWCVQSWRLYGNYQGEAFPPQKISETILQVCNSASSLSSIVVDEDLIETSSDTGNSPRYKCAESDLDFIENKLLPYTTINNSNVFFFVDLFGKVHLTSFQSIKNKKECILITIPRSQLSKEEIISVNDIMEKKDINYSAFYTDIGASIGNEDIKKQLEQIKSKSLMYNNLTGKSYIGYQEPNVSMGMDNGDIVNSMIPFNTFKLLALDATSSKLYPNRTFDDALAMSFNNDLYLEDIFSTNVVFDGFVDEAQAGETVYLYMKLRLLESLDGATPEEKKKIINWLTGKWVIKSVKYVFEASGTCSTELEIIKPTFTFNKKNTTIAKPSNFYGI